MIDWPMMYFPPINLYNAPHIQINDNKQKDVIMKQVEAEAINTITRTVIKKGNIPVILVPSIAKPKAKAPWNHAAHSGYSDVMMSYTDRNGVRRGAIQRVKDTNLKTEKVTA